MNDEESEELSKCMLQEMSIALERICDTVSRAIPSSAKRHEAAAAVDARDLNQRFAELRIENLALHLFVRINCCQVSDRFAKCWPNI